MGATMTRQDATNDCARVCWVTNEYEQERTKGVYMPVHKSKIYTNKEEGQEVPKIENVTV